MTLRVTMREDPSIYREDSRLEISKKKLRQEVLERIKYVQTCVLAREICLLVRTNRAVLDPKDVHDICLQISKLCSECGCAEASEICRRASDVVGTDEAKYLEQCAQSCIKCGEARRPMPKTNSDKYVS